MRKDRTIQMYEVDRGVIKSLTGFNFTVREGVNSGVFHLNIECDLVVWSPDAVMISNNKGNQVVIDNTTYNELVLH